ncbi:MAG: kinase [Pseudomonadota bacterium]
MRISLFGGGTDYREYYLKHGGSVIGTTIDKYVYVSINRLSNFFEYKIRVGYSRAELVNTVDDIIHPSVRECLKFKNIDGNLDIHIFADLPARTGLGSSSAFTVGFLNALYAMEGKVVSKDQLACDAHKVEQEMIRENVGSQDQVHAAYGGLNQITFNEHGISVQPVVISRKKRDFLEQSTMLFYTGQTRYASDIVKEQVDKTRSRSNDSYLKNMSALVEEAIRCMSDSHDQQMLPELGKLLHESWKIKKSLASCVSTGLIDDVYERGMAAGAYGGKVAGAGGGGFVMFIVDPDRKDDVRRALNGYLEVDFKFEDEGSKIIYLKS